MPWLAPIGTPDDSGPIDEPGADLAIHARVEIGRIGLHPRQRAAPSKARPLHRLRLGIGMRLARSRALDAMVDGADAGRQEQPFRRVHGDGGIEDGRARHHERMPQHLLHLRRGVGDAGDGAELAAGDRGRHADLAHGRRRQRRRDALDGRGCARSPSTVRMSLARQSCTALAPSVIEPPPTVTIRSAFAARAASLAAITASRGVCGGIASNRPAQRGPSACADLPDLVGLPVQRARDHQERARWRQAGPSARRSLRAAGWPNTTSSIAPKTTRPLCTLFSLRLHSALLRQSSGPTREGEP